MTQVEVGAVAVDPLVVSADRSFWRKFNTLLGVQAVMVWATLALCAGAVALLQGMTVNTTAALWIAAAVTFLFFFGAVAIAWIVTHEVVNHQFRSVRNRAELGAEQINTELSDKVAMGVRNLIYEWTHTRELVRDRDRAMGVFFLVIAAQTGVILAGATGLIPPLNALIASASVNGYVAAGFAVTIAGAHAIAGAALTLSMISTRCTIDPAFAPADAIARRMLGLLGEVKELRGRGVLGAMPAAGAGDAILTADAPPQAANAPEARARS